MKYLFYEKETETRAKIMLIYHVEPPRELLDNGNYITLNELPTPEIIEGKTELPYCNPQTGEFWYEYIDRPLTEEEKIELLKKENEELKEQQAIIQSALDELILGGAL